MNDIAIMPGSMPLSAWRAIAKEPVSITISSGAWPTVERSRALIEQALSSGVAIYGVNTGFGRLAQTRIPDDQLKLLQRNLVLSHSTGVGDLLPDSIVRLILALKAAGLARGYSGVRPIVIERLLELLNKGVLPEIPSQGSVGASGDLAPLAHLSAVLANAGANVTEIVHNRTFAGPDLSRVHVLCTVETRDRAHITEIQQRLTEGGVELSHREQAVFA